MLNVSALPGRGSDADLANGEADGRVRPTYRALNPPSGGDGGMAVSQGPPAPPATVSSRASGGVWRRWEPSDTRGEKTETDKSTAVLEAVV